ncbi:MAG: type I-C CRISPR-associated protein Cas8c/Csd1 [Bacilli bacterium]|nr:type I-C CRISPR-associated protein Cas8c/Csd1 [Bacilli bacterium]
MLLESLCKYYDLLLENNKENLATEGLSLEKISFCLVLSRDGELLDIMDLREQNSSGTKKLWRLMLVPEQRGRSSNVNPYFLSDNEKYILGKDDRANYKCFNSFKDLHNQLLGEEHPLCKFLNNLQPDEIKNSQILKPYWDDFKSVNFVFKIDDAYKYLHNNPKLISLWWNYINGEETLEMQCLISGDYGTVSKLHTPIKGVRYANTSGAKIISFNDASFESYGKKECYNAPVSIKSMFKYTTMLNYLLTYNTNRIQIGDVTVVFWAEKIGKYENLLLELMNPTDLSSKKIDKTVIDYETCALAKDIIFKYTKGLKLNFKEHNLDPNIKVHIIGITPNNARLFVSLYERNTFSFFVNRLAKHHQDLEIIGLDKNLSLSLILYETISKNAKNKKSSPILDQELSRSVFTGNKYPELLYNSIISRIRADKIINTTRAAIIKACLIRKNYKKEEYTVGLNKDSASTPYHLGRLFAVLDKAQEDALGKLDSTLKDRYFSSASSAPASVFPALLRLSVYHTAKGKHGGYYESLKLKIMDKIPEFPKQMTLAEQGDFVLGYYHQYKNFFVKKDKSEGGNA